jgi:FMN phosphatase YigB (HAD superfamily)
MYIFDLDGTLNVNSQFYFKYYTQTLIEVIKKHKGDLGLEILNRTAKENEGKGGKALIKLDIGFIEWANYINQADLNELVPNPILVDLINKLDGKKVLYTGSPECISKKILLKLGFKLDDFAIIFGWNESQKWPIKWEGSELIYQKFLDLENCSPHHTWSIGDSWNLDLEPAKKIGIKVCGIRKKMSQQTDLWFEKAEYFCQSINK